LTLLASATDLVCEILPSKRHILKSNTLDMTTIFLVCMDTFYERKHQERKGTKPLASYNGSGLGYIVLFNSQSSRISREFA